jgi:hypothetical protein
MENLALPAADGEVIFNQCLNFSFQVLRIPATGLNHILRFNRINCLVDESGKSRGRILGNIPVVVVGSPDKFVAAVEEAPVLEIIFKIILDQN